jgi:hypothetical protein
MHTNKTEKFLVHFVQRTAHNNLTVEFASFIPKLGVTAMNRFVTNTAYYCTSSAIHCQAHHTTAQRTFFILLTIIYAPRLF